MFFSHTFYGHGILTGNNPLQDLLTIYDTVYLYGGNVGTTIDKLWGRNIPLSIETIRHYTSSSYHPEWTPETYMYAEYEGDYEAGSIQGLTEPVTHWNLYRQEVKILPTGEKVPVGKFTYVDRVERTQKKYSDYNPTVGKTYQYYLFAETETQYSIPAISDEVESDYYGYYLIDVDTKEVYKIDIGVSDGSQTMNLRYASYDTNTKYNAVQKGVTQYMSGGIGGLVTENNERDVFGNTVDMLGKFRDFIYKDGYKYLKTRKGEIFNVFLTEYNEALLNQALSDQPMISSFAWQEIGEVLEPIQIKEIKGE